MGSGRSKLALRRRAYGGQVGTLAATGACTCRQGETLPRRREGAVKQGQEVCVFLAMKMNLGPLEMVSEDNKES